jgi:hypothetical protein
MIFKFSFLSKKKFYIAKKVKRTVFLLQTAKRTFIRQQNNPNPKGLDLQHGRVG